MWLRTDTSGGMLCTRQWNFEFHKTLGISWLAEQLPDSQEGLCSTRLLQKQRGTTGSRRDAFKKRHWPWLQGAEPRAPQSCRQHSRQHHMCYVTHRKRWSESATRFLFTRSRRFDPRHWFLLFAACLPVKQQTTVTSSVYGSRDRVKLQVK